MSVARWVAHLAGAKAATMAERSAAWTVEHSVVAKAARSVACSAAQSAVLTAEKLVDGWAVHWAGAKAVTMAGLSAEWTD
jgi:hypothetical protein